MSDITDDLEGLEDLLPEYYLHSSPSLLRKKRIEKPKSCFACGEEGLFWERYGPPWRLFNRVSGQVHVCKKQEDNQLELF